MKPRTSIRFMNVVLSVALAGVVGLAACKKEGPAEKVGEAIDDATGSKPKSPGEKIGDAVEDAGDEIEDAVD